MEFSLSAEQRELTEATVAFAGAKLNENLAEPEEPGEFPDEAWQACAQFGIQGIPVPAELGGGGGDILTTVLVMEALGYGCQDNELISSLNAQLWSLELPLLRFGTSAQQRAYLPRLVSGELKGMRAMTELDFSSDGFGTRAQAEHDGDNYRLNGSKLYITGAQVADTVLIFASHAGEPPQVGISAFLVDKGTPGFTVTRRPEKMRPPTPPMFEVVLTDCLVPAGNRLGEGGAGMDIVNFSVQLGRSCGFASALGTMQRQLERSAGYAHLREQFGQAIGKFQSVADRMADMYLRLEAARLLVYRAAWLTQRGKLAMAEAAAAKLFTSEAWVQSSLDSIQIHGGYGYTKEAGMNRDLHGAIVGTIHSGTSGIQRAALARMLDQ